MLLMSSQSPTPQLWWKNELRTTSESVFTNLRPPDSKPGSLTQPSLPYAISMPSTSTRAPDAADVDRRRCGAASSAARASGCRSGRRGSRCSVTSSESSTQPLVLEFAQSSPPQIAPFCAGGRVSRDAEVPDRHVVDPARRRSSRGTRTASRSARPAPCPASPREHVAVLRRDALPHVRAGLEHERRPGRVGIHLRLDALARRITGTPVGGGGGAGAVTLTTDRCTLPFARGRHVALPATTAVTNPCGVTEATARVRRAPRDGAARQRIARRVARRGDRLNGLPRTQRRRVDR